MPALIVEESCFGERRLQACARELCMSSHELLGVLSYIWHDSQGEERSSGTIEEIAVWGQFWELESRNEDWNREVFVHKLCKYKYLERESDLIYRIRGNRKHIQKLEKYKNGVKAGGKLRAETAKRDEAGRFAPDEPADKASCPAGAGTTAGPPSSAILLYSSLINSNNKKEVCSEATKFCSPEPVPGVDRSEIPQAGFETIPQEFQDPVILEFFKLGKIKPSTVFLWIKTYEDVQWLRQEFFKAIQYLKDNPSKRPKKNYARFMGSWFSRGWEWHRRSTPGKALGGVKVSQTPDFLD